MVFTSLHHSPSSSKNLRPSQKCIRIVKLYTAISLHRIFYRNIQLQPGISPHIPTDYCATDTFTFVQDIQSLSISRKFMVSFDVESLFTNIPLEECIDLAVNYISEGNPDIKLNKSELRSLFTTATAQTHFIFNSSFMIK